MNVILRDLENKNETQLSFYRILVHVQNLASSASILLSPLQSSRGMEFKLVTVTPVKAIFDFSAIGKEGASKRASIFNVTNSIQFHFSPIYFPPCTGSRLGFLSALSLSLTLRSALTPFIFSHSFVFSLILSFRAPCSYFSYRPNRSLP